MTNKLKPYLKEVDVKPPKGVNFATAIFRLRLPVGLPKEAQPKAIVSICPGSGDDGRRWMTPDWDDFCDKNQLGLLGIYLQDPAPSGVEDYVDVCRGSGQALSDALDKMGMNGVPLLMWGFSAGGEFNFEYSCYAPERVAAFVVNKGGIYYTAMAPRATRALPSLWFIGDYDDRRRVAIVEGLYLMNKANGAKHWDVIHEAIRHEIGHSEEITMRFFKDIAERL